MNVLLICLGGSLGAICRFYLSITVDKIFSPDVPVGILVVNVIGCFSIGILYNLSSSDIEKILTPFLLVGFLGSFTTFSAFSKETLELINNGDFMSALLYVFISVFTCIGSTWIGMYLTKAN